jgi:hypothetical protein
MTLHKVLIEGCFLRCHKLPKTHFVLVNCELRIANCDPDTFIRGLHSETFASNYTDSPLRRGSSTAQR